jgi:uncharacterized protein with ParB-like and HNH nuclease domain
VLLILDSKIERYQINTFTQDRAIETLMKWYKNGKLILPEFQREFVWSYSNSCRLIESILLNLPIPKRMVPAKITGTAKGVAAQENIVSILQFQRLNNSKRH